MNSYREISSNLVLKACEAYLKQREEWLTEKREKLIEDAMKPGLFGMKRTREQVIKNFTADIWSEYNMIHLWAGRETDRVKDLAALCRIPGNDIIHISAQDAATLENYI